MKDVCISRSSITFLFVFFLQYAASQTVPDNPSLSNLDPWIEEKMVEWKVPGLALAIIHKGEIYYLRGYGYADIAREIPVDEHTHFAIGSCTKAFTSAAICKLASEGKLELDEKLIHYLPDFKLSDEYATQHLTVRDLLSHRTGLPRHDLVWYGSEKSAEEIYHSLQHLSPSTSFRSDWQYQNLMYMVAGKLIQKVSDQPWQAYLQDNILSPIGMHDVTYSIDQFKESSQLALPYQYSEDKYQKMEFLNADAIGPAAGINSNVSHMAKWVQLQLNTGKWEEEVIIEPNYLSQSHTPHMVMPGRASKEELYSSYGMGWIITPYRGHLRLHHGGNLDGYSADVAILPKDSIGVVVLTNKNSSGLARVVRNTVIDRMLGKEEINWNGRVKGLWAVREKETQRAFKDTRNARITGTHPSHPLDEYIGTFEHPAYGKVLISRDEDQLVFSYRDYGHKLEHFHYNVFIADIGMLGQLQLQFHYNRKGEIDKLGIPFQQGVEDIMFKRVPNSQSLKVKDLIPFIGEYEMGSISAKVYLKDQFLRLNVDGRPEYKLLPFGKNEFVLENLKGFKVQFNLRDGEPAANALVSIQPNGNFTIPRKGSQ